MDNNLVNHAGRADLTRIITERMNDFFQGDEIILVPFGVEGIANLLDANRRDIFLSYMQFENVYRKPASLLVNYAPDYILFKNSEERNIYFLETKVSATPCWAENRVRKIRQGHPQSNESNIGEIAREALMAYKRYYPGTIVVYGCSYNPKCLMAQFASNIECLYCYRRNGEYDCNNCPAANGGFFDADRNLGARGSGTPNTNVNLDSFVDITDFFSGLDIQLNAQTVEEIKTDIRNRGVVIPSKAGEIRRNNIILTLRNSGCDWV